ncbi:hypothetical protein M9H77_06914 [Catharanthus roseus]|uniref:Uncharacterized protein n=1 Tax=Catharanthus roseus TaxID=4058 RepID=A0ACC0BTG3_CATRO|nr:hypothetical protein M9H77_06914 [Catharanthus roseus]
MTHKTNKDLRTIISTVKGVRIILNREHLASILGILDDGNSVTVNSNKKTINKDIDWSFDMACSRFEILSRALDHSIIIHMSNFSNPLYRALTYFFGHTIPVKDNDEGGESYNPSDDEKDEADTQNTIPMDAFQIDMRAAFEQIQSNQEIQGM